MAICPKCKTSEVVRKPGKGKTPICGACQKVRGETRINPKHYDSNGIRYGTPGRTTMRICHYCNKPYERTLHDYKTPVCPACVEKHITLVTPLRKDQKRHAPSAESNYRRFRRIMRKLKAAGLSSDWFEKQGGRCGICGTTDPGGKGTWHIDHDHTCCPTSTNWLLCGCSKCIRGILCYHCNTGLGHFRDDPVRLQVAITWVQEHRATLDTIPTSG